MKNFYEAPEAEVIDFQAQECLAVIEERDGSSEVITPDPGFGSIDF